MTEHPPDRIAWASIAELGRWLRDGTLSAEALTEALVARGDRLDPVLGAFRLRTSERALALARAADLQLAAGQDLGPLHGIPYGLKDIFDVPGLPTSAGWARYDDRVMATDSAAHRALARAGMVLLGKANTVQFASGYAGINHDHGTPHNPWHAEPHLPGGSSSGSAVGVAAGLFPLGLGSDTGGSVRGPASLCATVGLKTTVGRLSRAGAFVLSPSLDSVGPLTRTVEDAALVFTALQGPDLADATTHHVAPLDVLSTLRDGVEGLRIVFHGGACVEHADPEVVCAVAAAREVLEALGARVETGVVEALDDAAPLRSISQIEGYRENAERLATHFDAIDPIVSRRLVESADASDADLDAALEQMAAARAVAHAALGDYDAVITPTTRQAALPVAAVDASFDTYRAWSTRYTNTNFANVLGLCGVSVPCGFTTRGLPVGLQICARAFREDLALRVAYAYEQATPWHRERPSLDWIGAQHGGRSSPSAEQAPRVQDQEELDR